MLRSATLDSRARGMTLKNALHSDAQQARVCRIRQNRRVPSLNTIKADTEISFEMKTFAVRFSYTSKVTMLEQWATTLLAASVKGKHLQRQPTQLPHHASRCARGQAVYRVITAMRSEFHR